MVAAVAAATVVVVVVSSRVLLDAINDPGALLFLMQHEYLIIYVLYYITLHYISLLILY